MCSHCILELVYAKPGTTSANPREEKRGGQKWCDDFGWMKALVLCCNFFFAFSVLLACGDYSKNQRTRIQEWDNVISSGGQKSSFTFSKERDGYKVFIR